MIEGAVVCKHEQSVKNLASGPITDPLAKGETVYNSALRLIQNQSANQSAQDRSNPRKPPCFTFG